MTRAAAIVTATPVQSGATPNASCAAPAMELACTALKARPKTMIRQIENTMAARGACRPRAM